MESRTRARAPSPPLAAFVERVWSSAPGDARAERVVPTGRMHLVVRLGDAPLRLLDGDGAAVATLRGPVVGGARARAYVRELTEGAASVGAMLRPGAARALLGVPSSAFSGAHVELACVWGERAAARLTEQLASAPDHETRLARFEAALVARILEAGRTRLDPKVERAARGLAGGARVGEVADALGKSRRRFGAFFEEEVGLSPKRFATVVRVSETLALAAQEPMLSWSRIAALRGYVDLAHLHREVRAITGLSPRALRALPATHPSHLPMERATIPPIRTSRGGATSGRLPP